ncbi:MAG: hypothetical protein ACRBN8_24165 [Nannocystales bacterium]
MIRRTLHAQRYYRQMRAAVRQDAGLADAIEDALESGAGDLFWKIFGQYDGRLKPGREDAFAALIINWMRCCGQIHQKTVHLGVEPIADREVAENQRRLDLLSTRSRGVLQARFSPARGRAAEDDGLLTWSGPSSTNIVSTESIGT